MGGGGKRREVKGSLVPRPHGRRKDVFSPPTRPGCEAKLRGGVEGEE